MDNHYLLKSFNKNSTLTRNQSLNNQSIQSMTYNFTDQSLFPNQRNSKKVDHSFQINKHIKQKQQSIKKYTKTTLEKLNPLSLTIKEQIKNNHMQQLRINMRDWLQSRGKVNILDFTNKERQNLKKYFQNLDENGSGNILIVGSIDLKEIQGPFISMGIVENIQQSKNLFQQIDLNKTDAIEFEEFVQIIKKSIQQKKLEQGQQNQFQDLMNGRLKKIGVLNELSFQMQVSQIRRKIFLEALTSQNPKLKMQGQKIMNNYNDFLNYYK